MWCCKSLGAGVLAVLLAVPAYGDCEQQRAAAGPVKLQLVLDSSGSMAEPDRSGSTKIDAAKRALETVVDELPAKAQVGMRVYGASDFAESDPRACRDSRQVVPVGPVDRPALRRAIGRYEPVGWTPIAYALEQAAKDVGDEGQRRIVLVSDGEETCDRDPVEVARRLRQQGIDLTIDVVGFDVSGDTRRHLERIAAVGGGIFYHATNADELAEALDQTAVRPFRPFTVRGTPVQGAAESATAPVLVPGQYTDTLGPDSDVTGLKYYTLDVTPGATIHAAVTLRPQRGPPDPGVRSDALDLMLFEPDQPIGPDADWCAWARTSRAEAGTERPFLSASIFLGPDGTTDGWDVAEGCLQSNQLILAVARGEYEAERTRSADPVLDPAEIVVIEEPPVSTLNDLPRPAAAGENRAKPVPASQPRSRVVGGATFNDAPLLSAGSWTDTIQPGEQLVYRVHADWGQAPAVSFRLPRNPDLDLTLGGGGVDMMVYTPSRFELATTLLPGTNHASGWSSDRTLTLHTGLPPVRYRNREDSSDAISTVSLAGDYYFSLEMSDFDGCWQTPIEIDVAIDGQPDGEPAYVEPEPEPTPDTETGDQPPDQAATTDGESTPGDNLALKAAVGTIGGGSLILGTALLLFLRRRPRRPTDRH